ncbi:MAG: DUF4349 domain-containing protein [Planctomycetes bacterium]|nr:DUF4349 domain-containing protein [Planctomycetota bacterium]
MHGPRLALALVALLLAGCGSSAEYPYDVDYSEGSRDQGLRISRAADEAEPAAAPGRDMAGADPFEGGLAQRGGGEDGLDRGGPAGRGGGADQGGPGQGGPGQVADGGGAAPGQPGQQPPGGPLLIYQADITLAVHEVGTTQRAVIGVARELGGYLAHQDDTRVTVRVPAGRFQDAVDRLERVGDVVHRNIQAMDVSEEFRDLTLRLRNAEVVRERLEAILARAEKVEDALKVQAELARVTEQIELLKGRLRFLQDRLAYSTVTVHFRPRPTEQVGQPDVYRLPFPWLDELGLPSLLNLR